MDRDGMCLVWFARKSPELTQANIFSQEPYTDGRDKHQDPICVQGISVSAWNPVFEDGARDLY